MAPDATAEEVRRAYVRLALEHHPDRHADTSPGEAAAGSQRMAEVNAAWEVLGDHGRRLVYDRSLLAAGARSSAEDPFAHLVRRNRAVDEVHAGDDPEAEPAAARFPVLPIVVVLGALVAIFVFTAHAKDPAPSGEDTVRSAEEVPVGTCVTLPPTGEVLAVECGTPSDGTVASIVDWPSPCPVPLETVAVPERQQSLCLRD